MQPTEEFNTELDTQNDLGYHKQPKENVKANLKHLDLQWMKLIFVNLLILKNIYEQYREKCCVRS